MLDYARQRAVEALKATRTVILATGGPAGVQASEFPCEVLDLDLYILVPRISDHLFNLEHEPSVTLLTPSWELKGKARIIPPGASNLQLNLLRGPGAKWCVLVCVDPCQVQIRREGGWGNLETIDLQGKKGT
jgi:hypothetical protein